MSIDLNLYLNDVPGNWIEQVTKRLAEFGLVCEVHPEFESIYESHTGFLPIKMKLVNVGLAAARDKDYLTGFECAFVDFNYDEELRFIREPVKPALFEKVLLNKVQAAPQQYLKDEIIDKLLMGYSKRFEINWYQSNEELIANAFAVVLAELTSGLLNDPQADTYYPAKEAIDSIYEYINQLPVDEMVPFEGWIE